MLLPPSVELAPGVQVAPPLTNVSDIASQSLVGVPLACKIVAWIPAVLDKKEITAPEAPETDKVVTVVVLLDANLRFRAAVPSETLSVPKVLEPVIVSVPLELVTVYCKVPYVSPPPAKVRPLLEALLRTNVADAADRVRLEETSQKLPVPVALKLRVAAPQISDRAPAPVEETPVVPAKPIVCPFRSSVPSVSIKAPEILPGLFPSCHEPPAPLKVGTERFLLAALTVWTVAEVDTNAQIDVEVLPRV